jgi:2-polyprenyl-3-methyl-5-hydroxy-6-metoxy-1,4-benzoquinol methylase
MNEIASKEHYCNREYMRPERLLSYIDQLAIISKLSEPSDKILEVGKGNGYLSHYVSIYFNQSVKTVDIVSDLNPDFCVDISSREFSLPEIFDNGICFEVIEHIEWEKLSTVVENLRKYVRKYLIISIPEANFILQFKIKRLFFKYIPLNLTLSILRFLRNKKSILTGHFWEIRIFCSKRKITGNILINEIFGTQNIRSHYRERYFPGHHFIVLEESAR